MKVYRLEFLQPDGRWTGPYCAEFMTARAFELRDKMNKLHNASARHPFPDEAIFTSSPGNDRNVCASVNMSMLLAWFGGYLPLFIKQGGFIASYEVPDFAISVIDDHQVIYQQKHAKLIARKGTPTPAATLVKRIFKNKPIDANA